MRAFGFITEEDKQDYCLLLNKAMYGNIDSSLQWMKTFGNFLVNKLGMVQSNTDPCLFYKKTEDSKLWLIMAVYVDDCLIAGSPQALKWLKDRIKT